MVRKPIVMANWKMNKLPSEASDYIQHIQKPLLAYPEIETILAGQDVLLDAMVNAAQGTTIEIAAENVYWKERGAYTGETSPAALADLGIKHVIIGHSERRIYFRETNEMVNLKALAALRNGLHPIVAIDEQIQIVSHSDHMHWVVNEVIEALKGINIEDIPNVVLAFEPTQSIGSGQALNADQAQENLYLIRQTVSDMFDAQIADRVRIMYGGSVKPANALALLEKPDIDGVLVGDAALDANTFLELVRLAQVAYRQKDKKISS
ncbi:triose-phosphate isomerase [Weissella halotolerans]|uniref:Triosephosphate isomerase n=1 Tax=Weissella halotolerans DSM 20190 TaxID=1123500 RepID=A0A0R2FR66_9LACO|nr:triose-phosphate isomerase [Weissella halotolerans]KRN30848.1 triosephosphate isomerase [Weissella halotolerans DSM 20190]